MPPEAPVTSTRFPPSPESIRGRATLPRTAVCALIPFMEVLETDAQLVARCRAGDEARLARARRPLLALRLRDHRPGVPPPRARRRGCLPGSVLARVRASPQAARRRRDPSVACPADQAPLYRHAALGGARGARRGGDRGAGGVDDTIAQLDEALSVHDALATLPDNCQEILDRFFARDESYRLIGVALDLPSGTIASRISRCLVNSRPSSREEIRPLRRLVVDAL